jgi:hypothetical protein
LVITCVALVPVYRLTSMNKLPAGIVGVVGIVL